MRLIVTGHRKYKLTENGYDIDWIKDSIGQILLEVHRFNPLCYSGMADGIDLIFCELCRDLNLSFISCIPFDGQEEYMNDEDKNLRTSLLKTAKEIKMVKNSWMVENCDIAIVVWDGNKGGTHNVVQQLVEKKINFYWINPVAKVVWKCFK